MKNRNGSLRDQLMIGTVLLSAFGFGMTPAYAQQTTPAPAPEAKAPEIVVVTGSRIRNRDFSAISPVTSVGAEQVELSGTLSVETLLNELPQVIPGNTVTSNNAGGEDFPTVDLRGLGPSRSLVLVDGERVPAASTTGVVDISTIPTGLIEKIEVVTGGASSVYGSDAVAGVVNFILKDDYEGGQVSYNNSGAFDGNGKSSSVDFMLGGNFDNGKGNMVGYASYATRDGVKQSAYDYSKVSGAIVYGYDPATSTYTGLALVDTLEKYLAARTNLATIPGSFSGTYAGGGSGTPPWGSISSNAANPFRNLATNPATPNFAAANTDCNTATPNVAVNGGGLSFNDNGQLTPFFGSNGCIVPIRSNGSSRYNFAPDNYIYIPGERFILQTFANYQLSDSVKMKANIGYTRSISNVQLAATPTTGISVPVSSPAVQAHADLLAALNSRPTPGANFTYAWRSNAVGPRAGEFINSSLTTRVSFVGDLPDGWQWNVTAGFGQVNFDSVLKNNVNIVALNQGLAGCSTIAPTARLQNCVNVDIFGPNALTPAMASFIRTDIQTTSTIEQSSLGAYISGDLFKVPAGAVSIVLGMDYRDDQVSFIVDDAQRRGEISGFNAQQSVFGGIDVTEVYGEIGIPILKDLPFAQSLNVELGYRRSDYNTVGKVSSYKYGVSYAPVDWLRVRSIFNRAVRAPSALEAFQAGDQGFPAYVEPCRATATASNAALRTFCTTSGNIGTGFVPAANAPTFVATNAQVQAFAFGNPNLSPEEADTFTVGVVFEPDFLPKGKFKATVDYFSIQLANAIVSRGAQTILNSCYGNLGATAQSAQDCKQIVRDTATGQITSVNTSLTNGLSNIELAGYDIQMSYNFDLDEFFKKAPGSIDLSTLVTLTEKYDSFGTRIEGTTESGIGGAIPDWKIATTANYRLDDWTFQIRHTYVPGLLQDYPGGTFGGNKVPKTPALNNFDTSVAWDATDKFRLVANISNVTDKLPPQILTGFFDQANTDAALYAPWVLGRTYSLSARLKF
jgi:iron complex outermembrane recepter protein